MWNVVLYYNPIFVPNHWILAFKHTGGTDDTSLECPESCEGDDCDHFDDYNFELDKHDNIVPIYSTHAVHVETATTGAFTYEHRTYPFTAYLEQSNDLGTFSDADLADILEACEGVAMPNEAQEENCQDWVRNALAAISGLADLEFAYENTLDEVANGEASVPSDDGNDKDEDKDEDEDEGKDENQPE